MATIPKILSIFFCLCFCYSNNICTHIYKSRSVSISPLLIPEYGMGNEVSICGDVYSYGILLLELFTGKRPTDIEFGEGHGLRKYVEMALPDRVATVADKYLLQEIKDCERTSIADMKIACIASILRVGVQCSEEIPTGRMQMTDALKEMQGIIDRLQKYLCSEGATLR